MLSLELFTAEQSELHGFNASRGFTQDDAHIFCTPEQLDEDQSN
jgi:threonyl-tRNA synthetase